MDLRGIFSVFIIITTGRLHDVRLLNAPSLPTSAIFGLEEVT
jgi:hypothetical protein